MLGSLLQNYKLIFIILAIVAIGFVFYFMWKKWNRDLKKLEKKQDVIDTEVRHGVVLNTNDAQSVISEETTARFLEDDAATLASIPEEAPPVTSTTVQYVLSVQKGGEKEEEDGKIEEVFDDEDALKTEIQTLSHVDETDYFLPSEQQEEAMFEDESVVFNDIEQNSVYEADSEEEALASPLAERKVVQAEPTKQKPEIKAKPKIVAKKK